MPTVTPSLNEAAALLRDASGSAAASPSRRRIEPAALLSALDVVDEAVAPELNFGGHTMPVHELLAVAFQDAGTLAASAHEREPDRAALSVAGHRLARLLGALDALIAALAK